MTSTLLLDRMTPASAFAWTFLSDRVMGGVSQGAAAIEEDAIRLTGKVSTENNGGFVQVRTALQGVPPAAQGLILRVRGTPQRYFIHLRTAQSARPWEFFQTAFDAQGDWRDLRLPFAVFEARGGVRDGLRAEAIRSLGLAAYGRDHEADVSLSALGLY